MIAPLVLLWLLMAFGEAEATTATPELSSSAMAAAPLSADPAGALYDGAGLAGIIERSVFDAAYASIVARGLHMDTGALAIADMSQPSTTQRLVVIDLESQDVLLRTWVAHGQGSGGLIAERFSNTQDSHQTSLGLYRVGEEIRSPKHGAALLLHGLDAGVNDAALPREIIIHGADYVSESFIAQTGRLGRSWGCPAVPRADMSLVIDALADGGLLFVHGA